MAEQVTRRRVHERYECELEVTIVYEGGETQAIARNMSLGGMYVLTETQLPYGTEVEVRFRVPALKESTSCGATVRWKTEEGLGLQFGSLRALEVWALNQFFKSLSAKAASS